MPPGRLEVNQCWLKSDGTICTDDSGNKELLHETEEGKLECNVPLEESEIKCQEELRKCTDNKSHFEDNDRKSFYLTLNEHCTRMMKNRIEELTDFESAIQNDPLELSEN